MCHPALEIDGVLYVSDWKRLSMIAETEKRKSEFIDGKKKLTSSCSLFFLPCALPSYLVEPHEAGAWLPFSRPPKPEACWRVS